MSTGILDAVERHFMTWYPMPRIGYPLIEFPVTRDNSRRRQTTTAIYRCEVAGRSHQRELVTNKAISSNSLVRITKQTASRDNREGILHSGS